MGIARLHAHNPFRAICSIDTATSFLSNATVTNSVSQFYDNVIYFLVSKPGIFTSLPVHNLTTTKHWIIGISFHSQAEDVPASVHARRRFRESIFGENAAINRSDRRLSVLHRLRWLDFVDELLL
uniref:Uncharacterized protein n=1 Tax=Opuntia streptacantha TaxID=393608 RepID=A0A7C9AFA8_OPUST